MPRDEWAFVERVTRPALLLGEANFIDDIVERLEDEGVARAVREHDTAVIFAYMVSLSSRSGISNTNAIAFDARHGGIAWDWVATAMASRPSCPKLQSYWSFTGCQYRKGLGTSAEPHHLPRCPVAQTKLRKGVLAQFSFDLFLLCRDICDGDIVAWIDARLAEADPGLGHPDRATMIREALFQPLERLIGLKRKLIAMIFGELLLVDPGRERWRTVGVSAISVDTLVHAVLTRTGVLRAVGAEHPYGSACYGPNGCETVIARLANRVDAKRFSPGHPSYFPRWIEHCLYLFASADGSGYCNGLRIDDRAPCRQLFCPAGPWCDRVALRSDAQP